jgi:hypothetical protein
MKTTLLAMCTSAVMMLLSSGSRAQTTLEEYNYVTKGYKVQVESGLDMKKGYKFDDIHSIHIRYSDGIERETEFKALFKEGQKLPSAILCIYMHSNDGVKDYFCIPQFNSTKEIWDSTYARISSLSGDDAVPFMWGLAKLASFYSMK